MNRYQIRLEGRLDPGWSEWFEGFTLTLDAEQHTLLTGAVIDQAALHGLIRRVGDLGMNLISINSTNDAA
ncbi:hypothetical protein [Arthrobacter agilis]|uniref:hypothetical protein n=1 Tax=Arthrobacter agilis TaxID=37921 RepID=UPI00277FC576|nr:hypothetical protein [Arthrobacter agilis]MDQ0734968.1 hypothetical protein [Arthrobacter agilis]